MRGLTSKSQGAGGDVARNAIRNNFAARTGTTTVTTAANSGATRGRSLVELAQARAGGRDVSSRASNGSDENGSAAGSPARPRSKTGPGFADRMMRKSGGATGAVTWDPEKDDMPSPFLVRNKYVPMSQRKVGGA